MIFDMACTDGRIFAGAMIGSLALGSGDRWSDLDPGFGVTDGVSATEVLADWTPRLERECGAVHLFDLSSLSSVYRVFLFPGNLQVDLSFTPAAEFGARGPEFKVVFGNAWIELLGGPKHPPLPTCSASESTTRSAPESAWSAAGCGRRSTGSGVYAIRRFP